MKINNYSAFYLLAFFVIFLIISFISFKNSISFYKFLFTIYKDKRYLKNFYIKKLLRICFFGLSLLFLIIAVSNISWGFKARQEERSKLRISFVLDISKSMLSIDKKQSISRLEHAKNFISLIIKEFNNITYSLTIFKGAAVNIIPFTNDLLTLERSLDVLDTTYIETPGSFLGKGVLEALKLIDDDISYYNFLIVLSDGDDWEEREYSKLKLLKELNVDYFIIGIGGDENVPIIENETYLKDPIGDLVLTKLNSQNLERLSLSLNGKYYNLFNMSMDVVFNDIKENILNSTEDIVKLVPIYIYKIFLLLSFISLLLYILIRIVKWDDTF